MKAKLLPSAFYLLWVCSTLVFVGRAARGVASDQTDASTNRVPSVPKIEVDNWVKPQPGWLYLLDPNPDAGVAGGRIGLADPANGKVMGSIRTGRNADFALSPDGSRLYVASITEGDSSELAIIDTAQGVVVQRSALEDREVGNVYLRFLPWPFPATALRCEF